MYLAKLNEVLSFMKKTRQIYDLNIYLQKTQKHKQEVIAAESIYATYRLRNLHSPPLSTEEENKFSIKTLSGEIINFPLPEGVITRTSGRVSLPEWSNFFTNTFSGNLNTTNLKMFSNHDGIYRKPNKHSRE